MRGILLTAFLVLVGWSVAMAQAATPVGVWKTVDDETGEAKSHIEIYEKGGQLYGKVVKLLRKPADTVCEKCEGSKKGQPLVGMLLVEGLKPVSGYWKGGTILDPEKGSTYSCSMWLESGKKDELQVRGKHWSGLYRTQTWHRVR